MTKVTLAAPDTRKTIIVANNKSPKEILEENDVNFTRASVIIDGCILTPAQLRQSLTELGATETCTIAVCVKMDNAH